MTNPLIDSEGVKKARLGEIAELLARQNIDIEDIGAITKVSLWQGMSKDENGDAQVTDLMGLQFSPSWETGPEWPVVDRAPAPVVKPRHVKRTRPESIRKTVILPDPQIGYLRSSENELTPMHDEAAMNVGIQLIEDVRPDRVVNLGDFLDFSEWSSKFVVYPEFQFTTQAALDRGSSYLAQQRASAGNSCDIDLIGGNHDDRLGLLIAKNAKAALRLRRANTPESWPVLSVPYLLRCEELNVNYIGGYPAGRIKLADAHGEQTPLYALHGERLDMKKQALAERQSTVQGHSHHVAVHSHTFEYDGMPQQVQAFSLGCLCRIDGAVPSTKGAYDDKGQVVKRQEAWQQAAGILTETPDAWAMEIVMIHDGVAIYHDKQFVAEVATD